MSSKFHVSGSEIFEYLDAKNRCMLNEYGGICMTQEQVLYMMNRAAMEGLKYGGNLATSAAHSFMLMQQCKAAASESD